jgi:hypothetical protein
MTLGFQIFLSTVAKPDGLAGLADDEVAALLVPISRRQRKGFHLQLSPELEAGSVPREHWAVVRRLDALVASGRAWQLEDNGGYPHVYLVRAGGVADCLREPADPNAWVLVEAWDQS